MVFDDRAQNTPLFCSLWWQFPAGWYLTNNDDGVTRTGSAIAADDTTVYDVANRIIIDGNTPSTPAITGGGEADEFLIKSDATSVTINDDVGVNVIVFDVDVIITSITSGMAGAPPAPQYVITLASGKTITLRNPASFTFQHLGDVTRTDPISAEDFFTAYEDGFAASDASQPDITGANAAPTLVDAETATRGVAVNKAVTDITQAYLLSLFNDIDGDALTLTVSSLGSIGLSYNSTDGITGTPTNPGLYTVKVVATDGNGGSVEKTLKIAVGEVVTEDDAGARFTGTTTGHLSGVNLTFGSFEQNSGRWTYTLNSTKAQRLKAGEQKTDIVTFSDGTAVIVTVLGRNDAPVVDTAIRDQSGAEGQETVINLSNLFSDIDTGDTLTLSVTVELDGNEIVFDGSSNIISDPNANKMLRITLANTGTYRVTVVADDGNGGTVGSTFNIVVEADNPPVIGGVVVGTIAEDAASPITGTLTITDADGDAVPTVVLTDGAGQYGTLTFVESADGGTWTYTLDNTNAAVQALKDDTLTDEFTFTAEGAEDVMVTITISGVNDAPVVASAIADQTGTAGQAITAIDLSGLFTDVDTGDSFTLAVMVHDGSGRVGLDTLGLEYDSDTKMITGTLLNSVVAGTYTIEVIATDGGGSGDASAPSTFDIVIAAFNSPPVIGGAMDGTIAEDAADPITGTLTIMDAESDPLPTVELTDGAGQYGTMTFEAASGTWTYTLNNNNPDVQALKDDTLTEEFTFTAEGAEDFVVTITITGVNDVPVVESGNEIAGQTGTVGQAIRAVDLSGLFTDVDTGDELTLTVMVLSSDGTTKTALDTIGLAHDSDTQMITGTPTGSGTYTIEVVAEDGNGGITAATFEIVVVEQTIEATAGGSTAAVTEDDETPDPVTGTLGIISGVTSPAIVLNGATDDDNDGTFILEGVYGRMEFVMSTGVWTYTLDNTKAETQALNTTDVGEDIFIFTSGSAGFAVTITVNGVDENQDPVVDTAIVEQGGTVGQSTSIDLSGLFTDPDGDTLTLTVMVLSSDGTTKTALDTIGLAYDSDTQMITGTPTGSGTYTIEVVAEDGNGGITAATFDIVIAAFNSPPVIGGAMDGTIAEDAADPITGTLTITDAESDPLPTVVLTDGAGQYGTLTFVASADGGVWTYTLDSNNTDVQALKDDTLTDEFTFTAEGAEDVMVTITISGVNDAPVVASAIADQTGTAGQAITAIDLSGLFTDVDTGDSFTLAVMVHDGSGRVGLDTLGLEYDSDTKMITGTLLSSIDAGTYTIEVIATDGSGTASAPSTFEIVVAADNPPVIGGEVASTITEDAADPITGTLTITDADGDDVPTVMLPDGAGQYGTLTFDVATGIWTYTLDSTNADVQALKGDTLTDAFTFTAEGAEDVIVTITISGVNDAPVVDSEIAEQTGTAGQAITAIDLSGLFTDVDFGDTLTLTVMVLASDGSKSGLDTIGLEYDSDTMMITGTIGTAGTYRIEVIATDGGGSGAASQPSTFDIVVAAFNNPPVIGGEVVGTIAEDAADPITGTLTITDDDGDTVPTVALDGNGVGAYGTMTFVASADGGTWTYTLDSTNAAVQALKGDTLTDEFTFTAVGADPITVTITITGVNDAPVVDSEIDAQTGRVGQDIDAIDLSGLFTDVDEGDELTFEVTLGDGAALSTIGLTYNSDEDEITGTLTRTGTYVIKIVATDKSGAMVEATFDLEILMAVPIIQRNSLTYNPDETGSITIDETVLEVTSGNESDPTLLVYTITTLPDAGMLSKSGTPLNNGDTFTQADINNGLITYELPVVSDPSTSQSNPLSFTISDGVATEEATLEITSRVVVGNTASTEDNLIDRSGEIVPQKIGAGEGSDDITGGQKDDQIDGGAGDDEIILSSNAEEDAGADEVLYEFGYDGVGIDGGDEIVGFKRGQDKVTFVVQDIRQFANLEEFLGSLKGDDNADLTADDAFVVTMQWGTDTNGEFYFDSVLLHFKDATSFGGGRVSSPLVTVTFDQRLDFVDLTEILGGADKVAANFDFTHAAFKNLDEVLPRLFGEGSIGFKVIPFSNSISVIDGPVTGAEVFFDIDDDGEVTDAEKDAQRDESGRSLYITGDDGTVSIPKKYVGLAFVAVVGSAYDTDSGERLEGEFRSLDKGRGGIATPITDLIVTYLEEVEGQAGTPTTEQEVLDEIFGDDVIMVSDVLVMENYELPESGALGEAKKQMIIRAAIALAEIKKDEILAGGDGNAPVTKVEIASTVNTLVATPEASSVADLKAAVDERVEEVNAVKGGKPIATPTSVDSMEDTDYEFPETLVDLIELFGFLDPSGNSSSADASAFRGVYIKVAIENGVLLLDDNTPVVESTAGLGDVSVPPITGYIYITLDKLDTLKLRPALDFNGNLELIYRVWDGEESSSDVTLTITVTSVNDDPVATGSLIVGQNGQVGHAITAIDLSTLFTDIDDEIVTLDVFFFDSSIKEVNIGLSYNVADGIIGSPTRSGLYTIEVVASDNRGGEATLEFPILIFPDVESLTKVSGNGRVNAVVGNDEATSSQFLTGGDNAQTLNAGDAGDLIFGGRGDDIINLGDGMDIVIYRYDGADKTDSAAYDGGDVINNFNLSKDILVLAHMGGNVHNNAAAFFDAIKGFSLLVNDNGNITGIVFIFTDRETPTQDINLTVNFENDSFISRTQIDLTAFNEAVGGKRTIKIGQDAAAHQALIEFNAENPMLFLVNFMDLGFELNPAETDIEDEDVIASRVLLIEDEDEDEDDYDLGGRLSLSNPVPPSDLVGTYGTLEFDPVTNYWTYTAYDTVAQLAQLGEQVTETFTFTNVGSTETEQVVITVTFTLPDENGNLTNIELSYDPNVGIIAALTEIGLHTIRSVVSDGEGRESISYFDVVLFPDVTNLTKVLGDGVVDAVIGNDEATSHQFLLGGDNAQTLNAGEGGDVIFGGRGDDIINLGNGNDIVVYRYDGTDKTNLVAYDGSDVINNFSLVEDVILLAHTEDTGSVRDFDTDIAFLEALKGVSLLVDESGDITGVVFTFINRETPTQDINLTVNFENDRFISSEDIDLTAFNEAVGGKRTIKAGQEAAAHQALIESEDESTVVLPINFMDLGFELNPAETDIEDEDVIVSRVLAIDDEYEDDYHFGGTLGLSDPVPPSDLVGTYGTLEFDSDTKSWTYTAYYTEAQEAQFGEKVTETFTFTNAGSTETEEVVITVTSTLLDENGNLTNIELSYDPDVGGVIAASTSTEIGFYTIRVVASDGKGTESIADFSVVLFPDVTNLTKVLGDGVVDAVIGNDEATSHQFLLGGDNAQTLNAGEGGDVIFGGRGDDIINLGNGGDIVLYGYEGTDETSLVAYDGADVINDFDLDEDALVLAHNNNNVHENADAFYGAIKGISLLVDRDGNVTGIVFTFTDRSDGAGANAEVDLTVNFEDDLTPPADLEAAFENATFEDATSSGEREITSGQETAAYIVINEIFGDNLVLIDYADIGFKLNDAETDIV